MVTGNYDSLNLAFYDELGRYFSGSPYENLYISYMKRHERIALNMVDVVKENPGRIILFLTGVDHQVYARKKLKNVFRDGIELNSLFH